MEIEWKDILGYEGKYQVSTKGEVYSEISGKILKQFYRGSRPDNKYLVIQLWENNKQKTVSVHRLVAQAFIPNPNNLPCVNHIDGDKTNNCVENLKWCTYSENNYHAFHTGLKKIPSGTQNKNSKLTYDEVVEIKKSLILGHPEFGTRPLAKKYGVDHKVIMDIYHNRKYQEVKIPYTFFVSSDIHSAYTPWIKALKEAGFNENKYAHKLITCGDLFDRKDESIEVLRFVMRMVEEDKIILVKGNHDLLLEELCLRGFPYSYDKSNGTVKTVQDISGKHSLQEFQEACDITYNKLSNYRKLLVNYFETKNHIFVHSWIVVNKVGIDNYEYREDWRKATDQEWEAAMWGNCINMALDGLNKTGKTIVMGHYHCSYGHLYDSDGEISEFGEDAIWEPWYHDNCIAIDRCTSYTGEVNVLVIEDEFDTNWLNKYKKEFE